MGLSASMWARARILSSWGNRFSRTATGTSARTSNGAQEEEHQGQGGQSAACEFAAPAAAARQELTCRDSRVLLCPEQLDCHRLERQAP